MSAQSHRICPYCGNDHVIEVSSSAESLERPRCYCAGSLGCHASWNAADVPVREIVVPSMAAGARRRRSPRRRVGT